MSAYIFPTVFALAFLTCGIGVGATYRCLENRRLRSRLERELVLNSKFPQRNGTKAHWVTREVRR